LHAVGAAAQIHHRGNGAHVGELDLVMRDLEIADHVDALVLAAKRAVYMK